MFATVKGGWPIAKSIRNNITAAMPVDASQNSPKAPPDLPKVRTEASQTPRCPGYYSL